MSANTQMGLYQNKSAPDRHYANSSLCPKLKALSTRQSSPEIACGSVEGAVLTSQGCPFKGKAAYSGVCPEGWEWVWSVAMAYALRGRGQGWSLFITSLWIYRAYLCRRYHM